ncbi:hypothetical protein NDU88_003030 [Pleurodeles waltl]|uniref:Uncharacterized protein n=1 Tax=Pleurodeles waltl TaxID=8319 RepID=A0AAV7UB07_PLEWA|nr:hypothetical protein NDU88_003030 [Pleurodeles waltl]
MDGSKGGRVVLQWLDSHEGSPEGRLLPAGRLTQPRPRRVLRPCQERAQEESPRHLPADEVLWQATRGPGSPQVSAHSYSPRQRVDGSSRPECPVQVPTRPESAPAGARDLRAIPARGESHRRAAQGATPRPGAVLARLVRSSPRAAQPGRGWAGGRGTRESRSGIRLPAPPGEFRGSEPQRLWGISGRSEGDSPMLLQNRSLHVQGSRSSEPGLDCAPLRAPR